MPINLNHILSIVKFNLRQNKQGSDRPKAILACLVASCHMSYKLLSVKEKVGRYMTPS